SAPELVAYYEEWSPDRIIELSLSDGTTTIHTNLSVRIINVNDLPRPPVIVSPSNGTRFHEGQGVALEVELYDPDPGQLLEVTVKSSLDGTVLTFPSTHQGPITISGLNAGTHVLRVTVSDGEASVFSEVTILVNEMEGPPVYREPGVLLIILTTLILVSVLTYYSWRRRNIENDDIEA
ncbi:MAG: hypothetical protein KAQ96_06570, partial [Thermoplasmata archaeon]|nr:hypothetical protein [Thermoplasmata archaeon]